MAAADSSRTASFTGGSGWGRFERRNQSGPRPFKDYGAVRSILNHPDSDRLSMCVSALLEFLTMTFASRFCSPVVGLAALLAAAAPEFRATAAPHDAAIASVVQALVGPAFLLAEDGEREVDRGEGRRSRDWSRGGERSRGDTEGMMNDVMDRLSRIERMLAERGPMMGRGPDGPPAGGSGRGADWRGPGSPEMTPDMRAQWKARMKERRERWENMPAEERDEMKKQWEARMKEGREKMEAEREKWKNASEEEREKMKQEWQARMKEFREKMAEQRPERGARPRVPEEVSRKMEEARRLVEDVRKRAAEMEARAERLEAELERMKKGSANEEF